MADKKPTDKKVMDVAKPGEGTQSIGKKPMIIGHESEKDPMVKEAEDQGSDGKEIQPPSKTRKIITPISDDDTVKADDPTTDDESVSDTNDEEAPQEEDVASVENSAVDKKADDAPETAQGDEQSDIPPGSPRPEEETIVDEEIVVDEQEQKLEIDSKLNELASSKKYFVTVHGEKRNFSLASAVNGFLVTCLIGMILIALLIDADVIDLGITLPFDIL